MKIISHKKIKKNKIITLNDKIIKSNNIIKYLPKLSSNNVTTNNVIISLTTIPTRFIKPEFDIIIKKLKNQIVKPNFIILNICKSYTRKFEYDQKEYEKKIEEYKTDKNILLNICNDYGPATKALGLIEIKHLFNQNDIVICIDDDISYSNLLTYMYTVCYQLYNADVVAIDSTKNYSIINSYENIFYDNYTGRFYGWVSFSFKMKYIESLYEYYNKIVKVDPGINTHDDLIFTTFFYQSNAYICGINLYLADRTSPIVELDALKNIQNENIKRNTLESKFKINIRKNEIVIIDDIIKKRNLLFNVKNYRTNKYDNIHYDIKYFNNEIIMITLTKFNQNDNTKEYIYFEIDNFIYQLIINPKDITNKSTIFIKLDNTISPVTDELSFNILQTFKTNEIEILKFYSIMTILNCYPNCTYKFYSDLRSIEYFKQKDPRLIAYFNKLKPGAYKSDLFRAVYLYYEGGLYLDCKFVAIQPINTLITKYNEFYCLDSNITRVYNAIIFSKQIKSIYLKKYINLMLENIRKENYMESPLHITGPGLLGKIIKNSDIKIYYSLIGYMNGYICDVQSDIKYFSTNYSVDQYYRGKDNYLNTTHYGILWKKNNVYTNEKVEEFTLE
jgi:mannosyltransferase OCH1-like enzyme